jgi:hypothetical protein
MSCFRRGTAWSMASLDPIAGIRDDCCLQRHWVSELRTAPKRKELNVHCHLEKSCPRWRVGEKVSKEPMIEKWSSMLTEHSPICVTLLNFYEFREVISHLSLETSVSSSTFNRLFERRRSDNLSQFLWRTTVPSIEAFQRNLNSRTSYQHTLCQWASGLKSLFDYCSQFSSITKDGDLILREFLCFRSAIWGCLRSVRENQQRSRNFRSNDPINQSQERYVPQLHWIFIFLDHRRYAELSRMDGFSSEVKSIVRWLCFVISRRILRRKK